jgi:predicted RNA-binding protein YlqC (UPF0109 family)
MAEAQASEDSEAVVASSGDIVLDTLTYLASQLVEHRDAVRVETVESERGPVYRLHVHPEDMGRVIGKSGRMARALRQVTRAAAARAGTHAIVEIAE